MATSRQDQLKICYSFFTLLGMKMVMELQRHCFIFIRAYHEIVLTLTVYKGL